MNKNDLLTPQRMAERKGWISPPPLRARVYEVPERIPELQVPERKGRARWPDPDRNRLAHRISSDQLVQSRLTQAAIALKHCVEVNPRKLGGALALKGTRFSVAQVLSQIADGDSIDDLAENFDLDRDQLATLLHAFAAYLDKPYYK